MNKPIPIRRVNRPKIAAQKTYDRLSHIYDWLAGSSESTLIQQGVDLLAVQAGESILEIGSGTGRALVEICRKVSKSGLVCGLDLSERMLQVAGSRIAENTFLRSAYLACGDGAYLPYANDVFSAVFMSFTLELFDTMEIPIVLQECQRVLIPGGRLVVVALSKPEQPGGIIRLYEWFHAHFPRYVDCRPINAENLIQSAGFYVENQLVKSTWGLPVELVVVRKA